ncbi:MAG: DUF4394 domain-containing protein [Rudaea sp.]|nr:DUF4394 domain-containing protein [Rudaea sp.]
MTMRNLLFAVSASLILIGAPYIQLRAEPLVALTREPGAKDVNRLLFVDTGNPGIVDHALTVSGLPPGSILAAIDVRQATGQLYGYAVPAATEITSLTLYRINLRNGVATQIGAPTSVITAGSANMDMAFDPKTDVIRVAVGAGANYWSADPDVGGVSPPFNNYLHYAAGQGSGTPYVNGLAFDRNLAGTALRTLYAIERNQAQLVRVGGIDGTPSASLGDVYVVGPLNAQLSDNPFSPGNQVGFHISSTGLAVASFTGTTGNYAAAFLYEINLGTGAATQLGTGAIGSTNGVIDIAFLASSILYDTLFTDGFGT